MGTILAVNSGCIRLLWEIPYIQKCFRINRAAILAVSETSVRVSQSVSPLLFSIISMKWLWDGAYASGFAVGILILLVAFFVFEPRTAPSQK